MNSGFCITTMTGSQVAFAIGLAADEGWNPGLHDAAGFFAAGTLLAERYGMEQVFGTARMYTGDMPRIPQEQVIGVTTFELG